MSYHAKLLAGVAALAIAGVAPAVAQVQQAPMLPAVQPQSGPPGMPGMPGMPGLGQQQQAPNVNLQRPVPVNLPPPTMPRMPGDAPAKDANAGAAPVPRMGEGGFGALPPTPGKEDVADRMNLNGADAYVNSLAGAANNQLGNMTKGAVPSSEGLDPPTIANQGDLANLEGVQRQIQLLDAKNKLAKIAVEYWGTVYDNEHAKAWREEERKGKEEEAKRKEKEDTDAAKRAEVAAIVAAARAPAAGAPGGVKMMAPTVPAPLVYEVVNGRASVIVNGGLVTNAHAGTKLPDGSVITAVNGGSVVVKVNGNPVTLGYYSAPVNAKN